MKSYRPEALFDEHGRLVPTVAALAPEGERRMGCYPHANGGLLLRDLKLPDYRDYAGDVPSPGGVNGEATRRMGEYLRDVMALNAGQRNFRVMGPDETVSNRLGALLDVTERTWEAETYDYDDHLANNPSRNGWPWMPPSNTATKASACGAGPVTIRTVSPMW